MAKYGLDKMNAFGAAGLGTIAAVAVTAAVGIGKLVTSGIGTSKCNSRISDIDSEIFDLSSGLFGKLRNADKISELRSERSGLSSKRNKFF